GGTAPTPHPYGNIVGMTGLITPAEGLFDGTDVDLAMGFQAGGSCMPLPVLPDLAPATLPTVAAEYCGVTTFSTTDSITSTEYPGASHYRFYLFDSNDDTLGYAQRVAEANYVKLNT